MAQTREKTDHLFYNRNKDLRPVLPHLSAPVVAPRIQLPALTHSQHMLTPARHLPCSQTSHSSINRVGWDTERVMAVLSSPPSSHSSASNTLLSLKQHALCPYGCGAMRD